ncbi:TPA: hypothetical protein I0F66_RS10045 [Enterococcus faecalis]|nr:hypothetical protein [Enterococcus faecalis]HBI1613461.1 hypothetical protein [Enterococcus faecalis]
MLGFIVETLNEHKWYYISESAISGATIWFICMLKAYNQVLYEIQEQYTNKIQQTLEIAAEPQYFTYLLAGGFFIVLLVAFTVYTIKKLFNVHALIIFIVNLVILQVLLVTFWNPVLATFAMLLIGGGIFVLANS